MKTRFALVVFSGLGLACTKPATRGTDAPAALEAPPEASVNSAEEPVPRDFIVQTSLCQEATGIVLRLALDRLDSRWVYPTEHPVWLAMEPDLRALANHPAVDDGVTALQTNLSDPILRCAFAPDFPRIPQDLEPEVQAYLQHLAAFVDDADLRAVIRSQQAAFDEAVARVRRSLPPPEFIDTMEKFYGMRLAEYRVVPVVLGLTGLNVGPHRRTDAGIVAYYILAPSLLEGDEGPFYGFDSAGVFETTYHEFGHSFVAEALAGRDDEVQALEGLLPSIAEAMEPQGYREWPTALDEHLTRAGEIQIAKLLGNEDLAADLRRRYFCERGFLYLPELEDALDVYVADPEHETFRAFVPTLFSVLQRRMQTPVPVPSERYPKCSSGAHE